MSRKSSQQRKGQVAIELLVISAILLAVFFFFLDAISTENSISLSFAKYSSAKEIGYIASSAINEAYISGDRTAKSIFLPNYLRSGLKYNITIARRNVKVSFENDYVLFPLLTNATGAFTAGFWNNITNTGGTVKIG